MFNTITFTLNQKKVVAAVHHTTIILDYVRNYQHLIGTKVGCREGDCGACTILVGSVRENKIRYQTVNSSLMPIGQVKYMVTVEGLNSSDLSIIQQSFVDEAENRFHTAKAIMTLTM